MSLVTYSHERPIYAEKPVITIDKHNNGVITYRSFGVAARWELCCFPRRHGRGAGTHW